MAVWYAVMWTGRSYTKNEGASAGSACGRKPRACQRAPGRRAPEAPGGGASKVGVCVASTRARSSGPPRSRTAGRPLESRVDEQSIPQYPCGGTSAGTVMGNAEFRMNADVNLRGRCESWPQRAPSRGVRA